MATDMNQSDSPGWLRIILVGRNPRITLVRIIVLVLAVYLVRAFALLPIRIKGPSMLPTYQENGVNFVNRLAYFHSEPQRGDVVAIRFAGESILLMKRVVGLPGETVEFRGGKVFINGKKLEEPYMAPDYPCSWEIPPETLKPGWYYVVGDNRTMPEQFHTKGEASRQRIVGKILLCKNIFASSSPRR
jgi:signal peptidase I